MASAGCSGLQPSEPKALAISLNQMIGAYLFVIHNKFKRLSYVCSVLC